MSITCEPEDAVALLAQVTDLLGRLNQVPPWKLANDQTLELLRGYQTASSMLAAGKLRAIAEVDARGTAIAEGAASTARWIRGHCRERMGSAKRQVSLARALRQDYPETGACWRGDRR